MQRENNNDESKSFLVLDFFPPAFLRDRIKLRSVIKPELLIKSPDRVVLVVRSRTG